MIIQLTPFGKDSSIAILFNSLRIFMVSVRTLSVNSAGAIGGTGELETGQVGPSEASEAPLRRQEA